jgi:Cu-Zn family superoxide dismutase
MRHNHRFSFFYGKFLWAVVGGCLLLAARPLHAQPAPLPTNPEHIDDLPLITTAEAEFVNSSGAVVGMAELQANAKGDGVVIRLKLNGVPQGWHGFHIHAAGVCTPPDFASAKGHFNPGQHAHGAMATGGKHAGDLPNIWVAPDGSADDEILVPNLRLDDSQLGLLNSAGTALILHERADDYHSSPSGNAGNRIACAVVRRPD